MEAKAGISFLEQLIPENIEKKKFEVWLFPDFTIISLEKTNAIMNIQLKTSQWT